MIGKAINKIRKKRKMSQGDLCTIVDITQPYLSMLENNKADPSISTINKISKALEVPTAILFWFTLSEDEVHPDKKEVYNILKPSVDRLIMSIFEENEE